VEFSIRVRKTDRLFDFAPPSETVAGACTEGLAGAGRWPGAADGAMALLLEHGQIGPNLRKRGEDCALVLDAIQDRWAMESNDTRPRFQLGRQTMNWRKTASRPNLKTEIFETDNSG